MPLLHCGLIPLTVALPSLTFLPLFLARLCLFMPPLSSPPLSCLPMPALGAPCLPLVIPPYADCKCPLCDPRLRMTVSLTAKATLQRQGRSVVVVSQLKRGAYCHFIAKSGTQSCQSEPHTLCFCTGGFLVCNMLLPLSQSCHVFCACINLISFPFFECRWIKRVGRCGALGVWPLACWTTWRM